MITAALFRSLTRHSTKQWLPLSSGIPLLTTSCRRRLATAATTTPLANNPTDTQSAPPENQVSTDPLIARIVEDISGLTLLQTADLVTSLKARLNIQEIVMPVSAASAAAAPAGAGADAEEAPPKEEPKAKTVFNVKIESFDPTAKPKVIREVKAIVPNMTLMEAKKFVESLPKIIKENVSKEDADSLKAKFEGAGAVVTLE